MLLCSHLPGAACLAAAACQLLGARLGAASWEALSPGAGAPSCRVRERPRHARGQPGPGRHAAKGRNSFQRRQQQYHIV
jgi:hypothetical protein